MAISHSSAEKRWVFIAYRSLFSGPNANIRKPKKIQSLVQEHASSFKPLLNDLGSEKTMEILKMLLDTHVFESDIQAKIAFPELFQTTLARNVQRAALENEVARSEREALEELVADNKIHKYDKIKDDKEVSKQTMALELPDLPESKMPLLCPEISIPYNVQHLILTTTQRLLEECCFDFAVKWAPTLVQDEGWECPEAVELTLWASTLPKLCDKLPAAAIFNESGIPLDTIFSSVCSLRHSAVHRLPTSAQGIREMIQSAVRLAVILGDNTRAASLELVDTALDCRMKDMQVNKNFLENRLDEQLQMIQEQRAELEKKEKDAVATMFRKDIENKLFIGSILEASVRQTFGLHTGWNSVLKKDAGFL